jgi:uncharacterized membrane protein
MANPKRGWTDERVQQFLGNLLRAGVVLAAVVVLAGGTFYLTRHGSELIDLKKDREFHGEPAELKSISGIVTSAAMFHGRGIIQLGLLLLIATPVARVIFSVLAFALERDFLYVTFTLIVLAILVFGLAGGHL